MAAVPVVPDDQVVITNQSVQVSLLAADVQHHWDCVGILSRQLLRLLQKRRSWKKLPNKV